MRNRLRYIITIINVAAVITLFCLTGVWPGEFKQAQLDCARVKQAYKNKEEVLKGRFEEAGLEYPPRQIFIRVFKRERVLELWAWSESDSLFKLVTSYKICAVSGTLGPKRREGDRQIPEGFYYINNFNPWSDYHLSLQINYPNESDLKLGYKKDPGSLIFIHGNCVTIGCIPIRDRYIEELYIAAVEARDNVQKKIPVHIFPFRMRADSYEDLKAIYNDAKTLKFWDNLKVGFDYFEEQHTLPEVRVDRHGAYVFE
ncbi:MAG: L,D-transpeptidase family protein [Candidatus Zixiibacteriota bacterium]|nr:MAG: L,D-transpeptidase family protein [candidate division Zixibacteria bacterium]